MAVKNHLHSSSGVQEVVSGTVSMAKFTCEHGPVYRQCLCVSPCPCLSMSINIHTYVCACVHIIVHVHVHFHVWILSFLLQLPTLRICA